MRKTSISEDLDEAVSNVLPIVGKLLLRLWNHAMRLFVGLSIMPILRKRPWLFAVIIFVALAVFVPVGVLFLLCAFAAIGKNAKAENDFIVSLAPTGDEGEA